MQKSCKTCYYNFDGVCVHPLFYGYNLEMFCRYNCEYYRLDFMEFIKLYDVNPDGTIKGKKDK